MYLTTSRFLRTSYKNSEELLSMKIHNKILGRIMKLLTFIKDSLIPWLRSNTYCNYTKSSAYFLISTRLLFCFISILVFCTKNVSSRNQFNNEMKKINKQDYNHWSIFAHLSIFTVLAKQLNPMEACGNETN